MDAHEQKELQLSKCFLIQHLNNPYKIMLARGGWTCTVADFTGTFNSETTMRDGTVLPPTNKRFHIDFGTVARWSKQGKS